MVRRCPPLAGLLTSLLLITLVPGCQKLELPAHTTAVHWTFPKTGEHLRTLVEIHEDPGEDVGLYLVPYSTEIDGTPFYFGVQTDVHHPEEGSTGKGLIFSRWGTRDEADIKVAAGGFFENSDHEGDFVGVRRTLDWEPGAYMLTLERTDEDGDADWWQLRCTPMSTFETVDIGSLRFPRSNPQVRTTMASTGMAFTEVYDGVKRAKDVPAWHVDLSPSLDGRAPTKAESEYPAFPYAEFEAADVWYDEVRGEVHMRFGAGVEREHEPGVLFGP